MKEMVSSYGQKLNGEPALANKIRHYSNGILDLKAFTLDFSSGGFRHTQPQPPRSAGVCRTANLV
jgi:hypothetical protein